MIVLQTLHWLAGLIIIAEALNKLERTTVVFDLTLRQKLALLVKLVAWVSLAIGGAYAFLTPLLSLTLSHWQDMVFTLGFAALIIRTRMKETL